MQISPVGRVYVAACHSDFHLAKLCIAGVRYWYPKIPISLICDFGKGSFDPSHLLRDWNVDLFPTSEPAYGWGFSKLEPLFRPERERYVVLDSDMIMLGPVLDLLQQNPADFVVHGSSYSEDDLPEGYFSPVPLAQFDSSFSLPRYVFNTGQYLATSGILHRSDFDSGLEWSSPRVLRDNDIFKCGEQGLLNYVVFKAEAAQRLTVGSEKFYLWHADDTSAVTLSQIRRRTSAAQILHWNGLKPFRIEDMERFDILAFFRAYYFRRSRWRTRWKEWVESNPRKRCRERLNRLDWLVRQWLAGTPLVAERNAWNLPAGKIKNFYNTETRDHVAWRWSQAVAGIELDLPPARYVVGIETGSPNPMTDLPSRNLSFFLNHLPLAPDRLTWTASGVTVRLEPEDFASNHRSYFNWKMDPLEVSITEKRSLGMPITALRIHRLRR